MIIIDDMKDVISKRLSDYFENNIPIKVDRNNKHFKYFPTTVKILNTFKGHQISAGKKAGMFANKSWKVIDVITKEIYYLMFIEPEHITKLCDKGFEYIYNNPDTCNLTWYFTTVGYVATRNNKKLTKYLHQVLMEHFDPKHPVGHSIDHINNTAENKGGARLDNRLCNLRWASQSNQNKNRPKVGRHSNACELPEDVKNVDIPTYVSWCNGSPGDPRQHWRIEGLPQLNGIPVNSTKSYKKTPYEKYVDIMDKLTKLNKGATRKDLLIKRKYPIGIRYDDKKGSFVLDWRNQTNAKRYNLKLKGDENDDYETFKKSVTKKYPDFKFE